MIRWPHLIGRPAVKPMGFAAQTFGGGRPPERGRQLACDFPQGAIQGERLRYLLFLPEESGPAVSKRPLILFLHGAGERGRDLQMLKRHGPPKLAETRRGFPFIVVSPQCPPGQWWVENQMQNALIRLLDEVLAQHDADPDRVYLTGISMGGFGAWSLAARHPERFAALAPICGGGQRLDARQLARLPIWAFHGAKDDIVPLQYSQEIVEAVREAGGDVRLTVYPDVGHDSWTVTYENPELYEWLLAHTISD